MPAAGFSAGTPCPDPGELGGKLAGIVGHLIEQSIPSECENASHSRCSRSSPLASTHVASAVDVEMIKFSNVFVEIFRPVADNTRSLNFAARCAGVKLLIIASE